MLQRQVAAGLRMSGPTDPSLATFMVLA